MYFGIKIIVYVVASAVIGPIKNALLKLKINHLDVI